MASLTDLCVPTVITKMVWLKENIDILLTWVLLCHIMLPYPYNFGIMLLQLYLISRLPTASLNFAIPYVTLFRKDPDFQFLKNLFN